MAWLKNIISKKNRQYNDQKKKNRQYNDQKKKNKGTNHDQQNITQKKIELHEPNKKLRVKSGVPDELAVPAPLVPPTVLLCYNP